MVDVADGAAGAALWCGWWCTGGELEAAVGMAVDDDVVETVAAGAGVEELDEELLPHPLRPIAQAVSKMATTLEFIRVITEAYHLAQGHKGSRLSL